MTNVDYIHTRNANRIGGMIVVIWSVALIVSLAPQFGWKDDQYLHRIEQERRCLPSQDIGYQIFATCSTFYVPLLVILILYWKIFQTARKRIHRRREQRAKVPDSKQITKKRRFLRMKKRKQDILVMIESSNTTVIPDEQVGGEETAFTITPKPDSCSPEKSSTNNGSASHQSHISEISRVEILKEPHPLSTMPSKIEIKTTPTVTVNRERKKETLEAKRERKAAKTLAIITGAFVVCWLPFFVMALVMPLCDSCVINDYVASFFLWLGYFNSTLNPVIYTIFSPEFRQAFTRILCGGGYGRNRNFRSGKVR